LISSIFQVADVVNNRIFRNIEMELSKEHFRHLSLYFFNKKKTSSIYGKFSPSIKTYEY